MIENILHALEIVVLVLLIKLLYDCCQQSFVAGDPFGNGLKYYQFQDNPAMGPGSNIDLLPKYLDGRDL